MNEEHTPFPLIGAINYSEKDTKLEYSFKWNWSMDVFSKSANKLLCTHTYYKNQYFSGFFVYYSLATMLTNVVFNDSSTL